VILLNTTGGSISRLWEDQILQAQLYAYLMEQMGFDISEMRIFIIKTKQDIGEREKEALRKLAISYIELHKEKELEKVLPVKMFEVKYDRDFVMSKSSWALDYWLIKREPVPAKIASKCRSCEYSKQCKFSLAEKNSS
jgi:CRISPR/Cas system-associated exonuclease Cas4 (RecB family)